MKEVLVGLTTINHQNGAKAKDTNVIMDFDYTPITTIKFEKGIIEDQYFQKLYDDKTIIVADISGGVEEELAIIAPGVSEIEDVVDRKNTAYSVVSKVFLFLAFLCFPAVAFTGLIDNQTVSNISFVVAVVCLLTFSTLGMTLKGKVKNHKVINNTFCIPSALFNSTRTIAIKEKELIPTINSIAVETTWKDTAIALRIRRKYKHPYTVVIRLLYNQSLSTPSTSPLKLENGSRQTKS